MKCGDVNIGAAGAANTVASGSDSAYWWCWCWLANFTGVGVGHVDVGWMQVGGGLEFGWR